jgi:hypothetical protein
MSVTSKYRFAYAATLLKSPLPIEPAFHLTLPEVAVATEICADRVQGTGRKEISNVFSTGPPHCDDDRTAIIIADAPRTVAVIG